MAVPGFSRFTATGIVLNIDQEYVEPIKLTIGSSVATVEVLASAVQVNTTDMQLSNIVDSHQITELPLIGRVFTNLELILPGVQASSDRFTDTFSVNGSQSQQTAFVINGADSNDLPLNTISFQPNIDALQEFNLITGPQNAEYARNGGAAVSTSIKQGTDHFHGDVFEFYRDTFLNTRNFFQKAIISAPGKPVVTNPRRRFTRTSSAERLAGIRAAITSVARRRITKSSGLGSDLPTLQISAGCRQAIPGSSRSAAASVFTTTEAKRRPRCRTSAIRRSVSTRMVLWTTGTQRTRALPIHTRISTSPDRLG